MDIIEFFKLNKEQRQCYMNTLLQSYYSEEELIIQPKYTIAKGNLPICLVAHLDTVFKRGDIQGLKTVYYDKQYQVLFSPEGLGADDKAGLYGIIQILKRGHKPSIILADEEEKGGIGSCQLITDYPTCPVNVKYFIELDRQGKNDCVFYGDTNQLFQEYVEQFGFHTKQGLFSDIDILCPQWGISGANVSIGYVDEHSLYETFHLHWFNDTINKICNMIADLSSIQQEYTYIPFVYNKSIDRDSQYCPVCEQIKQLVQMIDVEVDSDSYIPICEDCVCDIGVNFCKKCGKPNLNSENLCAKCEEQEMKNNGAMRG